MFSETIRSEPYQIYVPGRAYDVLVETRLIGLSVSVRPKFFDTRRLSAAYLIVLCLFFAVAERRECGVPLLPSAAQGWPGTPAQSSVDIRR